ncbi:ABC transporter permease [Nocardia higoensis]|uniref:ABC transporter permease n=1 Tax=Nocardia higoensis TaxID=228599 RepID=UPI0003164773|nr:ABC transporter permease [Nocardia higoensis]
MKVRAILIRIGIYIPTVILAVFIIFMLQRLVPGDVASFIAGDNASPERLAAIREQLGLNDPTVQQFLHWTGGAFTGDLGSSLLNGQSVTSLVMERLPITFQLTVMALIIAALIGVPAGVIAARNRGRAMDTAMTTISSFGIAVPNFWLGMMLVVVFSLTLGWFPATGAVPFAVDPVESIRTLTLPAFALGLVGAAEISRQVRGAMIENLEADFIRTHRAKGLGEGAVVWRHALRNSSLPLLTVLGGQINRFLAGAVVVEMVFGVAGLGSLIVDATNQRDYPVVQGVVFVMAIIVLTTNLIVDFLYRVFDPRIA